MCSNVCVILMNSVWLLAAVGAVGAAGLLVVTHHSVNLRLRTEEKALWIFAPAAAIGCTGAIVVTVLAAVGHFYWGM